MRQVMLLVVPLWLIIRGGLRWATSIIILLIVLLTRLLGSVVFATTRGRCCLTWMLSGLLSRTIAWRIVMLMIWSHDGG